MRHRGRRIDAVEEGFFRDDYTKLRGASCLTHVGREGQGKSTSRRSLRQRQRDSGELSDGPEADARRTLTTLGADSRASVAGARPRLHVPSDSPWPHPRILLERPQHKPTLARRETRTRMSLLEHFAALRAHGEWADGKLLEAVRTSDVPLAMRELAHVRGAQEIWLSRIEQRAPTVAIWPEFTVHELGTVGAVVDAQWRTFFGGLNEQALNGSVSYRSLAGDAYTTALGHILSHVLMHGHYHRGKANAALGRVYRIGVISVSGSYRIGVCIVSGPYRGHIGVISVSGSYRYRIGVRLRIFHCLP